MKSFRTVVALVAAVLVAVSASAQIKGNARLSGKVLDEQGQPVPDVQVRAQMSGQTELITGKTDKKGEWRLNGLAGGEWRIEFLKDGLEPNHTKVDLKSGSASPLTVTMTKLVEKVDPTVEINAELGRAATLAQGGKITDARKIYEDLFARYPDIYQMHGFIARAYVADNQPAPALAHVKTYLEKEPANVEMKLLLAELLLATGDKEEAMKILDGVDMAQVKDPFPFINAAITMINDKKAAEAVDALTKLLARFPSQTEIYYYRGRAYIGDSKLDQAKADLEKFVSLAPPDSKESLDAKRIIEQLTKK